MKDLETIFSLIAGLMYILLSMQRKRRQHKPAPDWEEMWPEPMPDKQEPTKPIARESIQVHTSISQPNKPLISHSSTRPYKSLSSKHTLQQTGKSMRKQEGKHLTKMLNRYDRLKGGFVLGEIFRPKYH